MASFSILLVDDDPLVLDVLQRAAVTGFPEAEFMQVVTFEQARAFLETLNQKMPCLVLLDINLQETADGLDFLALLRAHPRGRSLPVVMLSAIDAKDQIERSYFIGASSYTVKPFSFGDWKNYLAHLRAYWLETVKLPS